MWKPRTKFGGGSILKNTSWSDVVEGWKTVPEVRRLADEKYGDPVLTFVEQTGVLHDGMIKTFALWKANKARELELVKGNPLR